MNLTQNDLIQASQTLTSADNRLPVAPKPVTTFPRLKFNAIFFRLTFSALVFVISLFVADQVWGLLFQTPQRYLLRLAPNFVQRHKTSEFNYEFRTNSLGLRGKETSFQKHDDSFRIVVLGDSFVAGNGVSETHTFCHQLQSLQNESKQNSVPTFPLQTTEVINVGRTGVSTVRAVDLYQLLGRRFHPDVVILAYYVGNDLTGVTQELTRNEFSAWRPQGRFRQLAYGLAPNLYLEWKLRQPVSTVLGQIARGNSGQEFSSALRELTSAAGFDADLVQSRYRAIPSDIRKRVEQGLISEHRVLLACLDPKAQKQALFPTSEFFEVAWQRTKTHLETLRRDVERDSAKFVLVIIPTACQIDTEALNFNRKLGYEVDESWLNSECTTALAVQNWARSNSVPVLNLTEPFRNSTKKLYFTEDTHLTPEGHQELARLLDAFLKRSGLLPKN